MSPAASAISVDGAVKRYRRSPASARALDGVSLQVERGRITGLLGPNGAGKSTLIHAIIGLVDLDRGRTELFGIPAGVDRAREGVGFLPEEVTYEAGLRIKEILWLHSRLAGGREGASPESALRAVGLDIPLRRRISHCSQGMARRVALAGALLGRPRLLILDEPTSGMDVPSRDKLFSYLRRFREEGGTVLISSHILSELQSVCDAFAILKEGRVIRSGDLDTIRSDGKVRIVVEGLRLSTVMALLGEVWTWQEKDGQVIAETSETRTDLVSLIKEIERAGGRLQTMERGRQLKDVYRDEFTA